MACPGPVLRSATSRLRYRCITSIVGAPEGADIPDPMTITGIRPSLGSRLKRGRGTSTSGTLMNKTCEFNHMCTRRLGNTTRPLRSGSWHRSSNFAEWSKDGERPGRDRWRGPRSTRRIFLITKLPINWNTSVCGSALRDERRRLSIL
jgi:hypothetical protein